MKMSTKGRYAVRILLSIARYQHNGPVPKKIIAAEGFKLSKEPEDITVFQILRASEGVMSLVDCAHMDCKGRDKNKCVVRPVWAGAAKLLEEYFSKITLRDLLDAVAEIDESGTTSYSI